jgi:hypothetical protein
MQSHSALAFELKIAQTVVLQNGITQEKAQPKSYHSIQYGVT